MWLLQISYTIAQFETLHTLTACGIWLNVKNEGIDYRLVRESGIQRTHMHVQRLREIIN